MSLQSRFAGCGEGESRRRDSYGDSLPLVECAAVLDSKKPHQAPADSNVPFGIFSPSFPGQVVDGTEDSAKCIAPSAGSRG